MHTAFRLPAAKSSLQKAIFLLALFWVAGAIGSPAQTLTTLYSFCSQTNCADGTLPHAGLVQGTDGNFYGTTSEGQPNSDGTVFKLTPSGTLITLHSFSGADGADPLAEVAQGTDGNFYGTTVNGGANNDPSCVDGGFTGCGTVFKVTPEGSFTTIYNFCSLANCFDGSNPRSALVQGNDGNLYGTSGGQTGGTFFKITPGGTLTTLYNFCSQPNCADGEYPLTLLQGADGNFYGTTYAGGTSNNCTLEGSVGCGTIFKITPQGALTTLYSFSNADGCYPEAGLVQGTDGNFYGTTSGGGLHGYCGYPIPIGGTVFKITPAGTLTTLYSFCSGTNCTDGDLPYGELVQATDGNFYGTTDGGGGHGNCGGDGCGTVFKITSQGTFTTLYDFCSQTNCADGVLPYGKLIQASDGNFYGTTYEGGSHGGGTVFRLSVELVLSPGQFVPATPCRLADTRQGSPIQGGTWQVFVVPQLGGCNIPSNASAYSLNVTVVPHGPLGYLTIWPAGRSQPTVSTMNSLDGRTKANAAIVPAGASGAVSIFASNTTDLVLDIDGYFTTPGSQTLQFYPLTPCRVIDTRGPNSNLGGPFLSGGMERDFNVPTSSCIPSGVNPQAYSFNVTVVPHTAGTALGYLTIWPQGETQPTVSTLNNPTATDVANAAIVPAGANGGIAVFPSNETDLVIDINGYFAAPGMGGLSLYQTGPCRVLDTRGVGSGNPIVGEYSVNVAGSACSPPANAQAYVFNATVVPSGALGYLSLWPDGQTQPVVSTLNALDGAITSNMAIVPTMNGSIDAFASSLTQLVLDISSYFAP